MDHEINKVSIATGHLLQSEAIRITDLSDMSEAIQCNPIWLEDSKTQYCQLLADSSWFAHWGSLVAHIVIIKKKNVVFIDKNSVPLCLTKLDNIRAIPTGGIFIAGWFMFHWNRQSSSSYYGGVQNPHETSNMVKQSHIFIWIL